MRRYQVARPVGVLVRLLYTARLSYCSSCNTRARVLTAQCALLASAAVCHPRCRRSIDRISARPAPTLAFFPPSPTCDVTGWPRPRRSIRVPARWLAGWLVCRRERGDRVLGRSRPSDLIPLLLLLLLLLLYHKSAWSTEMSSPRPSPYISCSILYTHNTRDYRVRQK